jgi:hypothetical protein
VNGLSARLALRLRESRMSEVVPGGRGLPTSIGGPGARERRWARLAAFLGMSFAMIVATASATASATGWRVVKSGSSSGRLAGQSITATVDHPVALSVQFIGRVTIGEAIISCSNGFGVRSWSHAGVFRLPVTPGADSCVVAASVGGSGRVTVQLLSYR